MPSDNINDPILVVDIGNTNIVCAEFFGVMMGKIYRLPSHPVPSQERLKAWFDSLALHRFVRIAIASVVPDLGQRVCEILKSCPGIIVSEISAFSDLGISYKAKDLASIGADLVVNALAAWKLYPGHNLVVDLGTATTIQMVSDAGLYAGVAIAPGLQSSADTLARKAARLQPQKLESPKALLANNTRDAMLSGIMNGHAFMIDAFIQESKLQYPAYLPFQVIVTGGLAPLLTSCLQSPIILDNSLTLKGLRIASEILASKGNTTA